MKFAQPDGFGRLIRGNLSEEAFIGYFKADMSSETRKVFMSSKTQHGTGKLFTNEKLTYSGYY